VIAVATLFFTQTETPTQEGEEEEETPEAGDEKVG